MTTIPALLRYAKQRKVYRALYLEVKHNRKLPWRVRAAVINSYRKHPEEIPPWLTSL